MQDHGHDQQQQHQHQQLGHQEQQQYMNSPSDQVPTNSMLVQQQQQQYGDDAVKATATTASTQDNSSTSFFQTMTRNDPDHYGGMIHEVQQARNANAAAVETRSFPSGIRLAPATTTTAASTAAATNESGAATSNDQSRPHPKQQLVHSTTLNNPPTLTGRFPILMYLSCDPDSLSPFQCLIRRNIEFFEATSVDVQAKIQGRNRPIVLGQVRNVRMCVCACVCILDFLVLTQLVSSIRSRTHSRTNKQTNEKKNAGRDTMYTLQLCSTRSTLSWCCLLSRDIAGDIPSLTDLMQQSSDGR